MKCRRKVFTFKNSLEHSDDDLHFETGEGVFLRLRPMGVAEFACDGEEGGEAFSMGLGPNNVKCGRVVGPEANLLPCLCTRLGSASALRYRAQQPAASSLELRGQSWYCAVKVSRFRLRTCPPNLSRSRPV